jgi:hypothetical protein
MHPSKHKLNNEYSKKRFDMGTYVQTGLIYQFSTEKSGNKSKNVSHDDFKLLVARAVVGNPDLYSCEDDDGICEWTMKKEAWQTHLSDFWLKYLGDFYGAKTREFAESCDPVISFLSTNPSEKEFNDWLEEGDVVTLEDHGWYQHTIVQGQEITIRFSFICLTYEGKVEYEEFGKHLSFFEKAIREKYSSNPLGGCLIVCIG